jgi:hypothetical protein
VATGVAYEGTAVGVVPEGHEQLRRLLNPQACSSCCDLGNHQLVWCAGLARGNESDLRLQRDERRLVPHAQRRVVAVDRLQGHHPRTAPGGGHRQDSAGRLHREADAVGPERHAFLDEDLEVRDGNPEAPTDPAGPQGAAQVEHGIAEAALEVL